ncbi:Hypothetical protein PHPALM_36315 [Phytophthora palmivora]|uniref:Uncharacterized protein n=1 Tax=Phytophthora palmivora TaxID=4796 RepID=A0A2P4X0B1_9STRA|nr:Hypothetical protein PHPALM_36315 [Phytophthora palmivora]
MVIPLPLEKPITRIGAHSSKVNCFAYSNLNDDGVIFLASGGKDRLIQLYDCQKRHTVLSTLESHSAAVINVSLSRDGKTLLSCGADDVVSLSEIDVNGKVIESKVLSFSGGKVFDMVLLPDNDTVVASHSNKLEVVSAKTGKQQQTHLVGEQHHVAICPANHCVALSGSLAERTIHVVDIVTGDTIATGTGHSEAVTALKFTPDCRRLLSASSDGCIFVWRLADDIQAEIKAKLPRVSESPRQMPPPSPVTKAENQPSAMPPPAPPISRPSNTKNSILRGASSSPAVDHVHSSQTSEVDKAAPMRVSKRSPAKWKGNGVAVPGPMAGIPMEEWMRTRATAKPTIHVIDDDSQSAGMKPELKPPVNNGTLAIDRLQTPAWAKTAQPGTDFGQPIPNPTLGVEVVNYQAPVNGKWGNQIAVTLPSNNDAPGTHASDQKGPNFQPTSIVGEHTQADPVPISSTKTDMDELTELSVEMIDTSPKMSSSLAIEREQLEKRKKQIDTVNAVATMNTRLSQLGLLKALPVVASTSQSILKAPSPLKRQIVAEGNTSDLRKSPIPEVNVSPGSGYDAKNSNVSQVVKLEISECKTNVIPSQEIKPTKSEVAPDRSMSSQESMPNTQSGSDVDKVTDDLVSQALQTLNNEEPPRPLPMDVAVDVAASLSVHVSGYDSKAIKSSGKGNFLPNLPPLVEVDASLSTFTSGFVAPSESSNEVALSNVAMSEPVASSLSAFTIGYGSDTKAVQSNALVSVKPTESITIVEGSQQIPVDISLSNFTSGYGSTKGDNTVRSNEAVRPPTMASADGQDEIDPKLQEIQHLIAALRSSIANFTHS